MPTPPSTGPTFPLPSVQLDDVRIGFGNAVRGSVTSNNTETFALSDGDTLTVAVDGGGAQTLDFNEVDFANIALATAAEIVFVINAQITGAVADAVGGAIRLTTNTYGAGGSIQVTGGTGNTALAFPTSVVSGTNATGVQLINRIPEPDEPGVPAASDIQIDIFSNYGSAPGTSAVEIYINSTLAYDGAGTGFQVGFDGTNSAVSLADVATLRFVIDPTTDFQYDSEVEVRVVVSAPALDETYSFFVQDLINPVVDSILPVGKKSIRVTFNEEVNQSDASSSDDALNPANYTIVRNPPANTPAVRVEVVGVTSIDDFTVELQTDIELTFGIEYLLTVENVEDLSGNVISVISADIPFDAFVPDYPAGRNFVLWEMLPQLNRQEDVVGDLARFIAVLQEVTNVMLCEIDSLSEIIDPDFADAQYLDAMLIDMGNPFDFVELEEIDKRRLIQTLVPIYKLKGTEEGIISTILFLLGLSVTLNVFNTGTSWILGPSDVTQVRLQSTNAEPFALSDGQTLIVRLDDADPNITVTFLTADFATIGAATAAEVAAVIRRDVSGVSAAEVPDGTILLQRDERGAGTALEIRGGTAAPTLGFPTGAVRGTGTESTVVSELGVDSILHPGSGSRLLYSYEIISPIVLTDDQRDKITQIAEYMHPAHCHLLRIVEPGSEVEPDHLELGISQLGGTSGPGTWIMHP